MCGRYEADQKQKMTVWKIPGSHQMNRGQLYGHEHDSKCADCNEV
jgi:hypothetical protein